MGQLAEIIMFSLKWLTNHGAVSSEFSRRSFVKIKCALGGDLGVLKELCYI